MAIQILPNTDDVESQDEMNGSFDSNLSGINRVLEAKNVPCQSSSVNGDSQLNTVRSLSLYPVNPKPFKKMHYTTTVENVGTTHQAYLYGSLSLDNETVVLAN